MENIELSKNQINLLLDALNIYIDEVNITLDKEQSDLFQGLSAFSNKDKS